VDLSLRPWSQKGFAVSVGMTEAVGLNGRAPFRFASLHDCPECLGFLLLAWEYFHCEISEPRSYRRIGEGLDDGCIEFVDNAGRCAPRREKPSPCREIGERKRCME